VFVWRIGEELSKRGGNGVLGVLFLEKYKSGFRERERERERCGILFGIGRQRWNCWWFGEF